MFVYLQKPEFIKYAADFQALSNAILLEGAEGEGLNEVLDLRFAFLRVFF